MSVAEVLARLEGVRLCAGGWTAKCPAHHDRNASLSVGAGDGGKLLLRCHAGCSFAAIIAAIGGQPSRHALSLGPASPGAALDDAKRSEIARRIWRGTRPAADTLVDHYLRSRGITLPVPPTLRFHPPLRHPSGVYAPAMVAAVELAQTGTAVMAIHRTWLRADGSGKADVDPPKAAIGPIGRGAVRLAPAAETLALAEGIESALSIQQATGIAAWATLGTANLARVELPDCVRQVIIAADADAAGEFAAQTAAQKFLRENRKVRIARPSGGKDFNEMRL
jgi:putative DNA primase/helicase